MKDLKNSLEPYRDSTPENKLMVIRHEAMVKAHAITLMVNLLKKELADLEVTSEKLNHLLNSIDEYSKHIEITIDTLA